MQIVDNAVILILIVGAFIAGLKISDYYHDKAYREKELALQRQYVRLQTGSDSDDPTKPYVPVNPIDDEFMARLRSNRRATVSINKAAVAGGQSQ